MSGIVPLAQQRVKRVPLEVTFQFEAVAAMVDIGVLALLYVCAVILKQTSFSKWLKQ